MIQHTHSITAGAIVIWKKPVFVDVKYDLNIDEDEIEKNNKN